MSDERLHFDDLSIGFGQQLLLHPDPNNKRGVFSCMMMGYLPGESIIATVEANGIFPRLQEGQRVAIRIFLANGVAAFTTTVLYVGEEPVVMVYLDFPLKVQFKRVRAAKRVSMAQPLLVSNLDDPSLIGVAGKLIDISTGGGRIEMFDQLGRVGETIEMKGKFSIHGMTRMLTIKAVIRKREGNDYGVQFIEEDEDKLIILMGFIFGAMLDGNIESIR